MPLSFWLISFEAAKNHLFDYYFFSECYLFLSKLRFSLPAFMILLWPELKLYSISLSGIKFVIFDCTSAVWLTLNRVLGWIMCSTHDYYSRSISKNGVNSIAWKEKKAEFFSFVIVELWILNSITMIECDTWKNELL